MSSLANPSLTYRIAAPCTVGFPVRAVVRQLLVGETVGVVFYLDGPIHDRLMFPFMVPWECAVVVEIFAVFEFPRYL